MMRLSEGFQTVTLTFDIGASAPPPTMPLAQVVVIGPRNSATDLNGNLFLSNAFDGTPTMSLPPTTNTITNSVTTTPPLITPTWSSYGTRSLISIGGRGDKFSGVNAAGAVYATTPGTALSAAQWNQTSATGFLKQISRDTTGARICGVTTANQLRYATQNIDVALGTTPGPNWTNASAPTGSGGAKWVSVSNGRAVCVAVDNKVYYTANYAIASPVWVNIIAESNQTSFLVNQAVLDDKRVGIITSTNQTWVADLSERGVMDVTGTLTGIGTNKIRWFNSSLNARYIDMLQGRILAIGFDNRIHYKSDYRILSATGWTRVPLPDFTTSEVFLYRGVGGVDSDTFYYNAGASICQSFGARVARLADLTSTQTAEANDTAHWCGCGFVEEKSTHSINNGASSSTATVPLNCSGVTTSGVIQCTSTATAAGGNIIYPTSYAQTLGSNNTSGIHCFGVKPKEGVDAKVRPFRTISTTNTRWNMSPPLAVHFLQDPAAATIINATSALADAVAVAEREATEAERQRGIVDRNTGLITSQFPSSTFNENTYVTDITNARNAASNAEAASGRATPALTIATTNAAIINTTAANTEKTRTETAVNRATTAATAARNAVTTLIERFVTYYADRADNAASSTELETLKTNAENLRSTTTVSNVTDTTVTNIETIVSDATTRQTNATTAFNDATRHADTINTTAGNASKERARQAVTRATTAVTSITPARDAIIAMRREKTVKDSADNANRYANEAEAARNTASQFRDTAFRGSETRATRDSAVTSSRTNSDTSEQKRQAAVGESNIATEQAGILNTPSARSERDRATTAVSRAAAAALAADAAADEAEPIGVELRKLIGWAPNLANIQNTAIPNNVWRGPILSQADSTAGLTMTMGVTDANKVGFWRPMNEPITDNTSDQIWVYTENMELVNLFSRKCLDTSRVDAGQTSDGLSPEMFTCAGRNGQKWFIDSESRIRPINNKNLCLTLTSFTNPPSQPSGNTALRVTLGQPIQLKTCTPNGNKMQRFFTTGGVPLAGRRTPMPGVGAPNAAAAPPIPDPVNREGFRDKYIPREMSLATRYTDDAF